MPARFGRELSRQLHTKSKRWPGIDAYGNEVNKPEMRR
jgi:hypothetical protein